jgi:hypothetical protein
MKRFVGKENDAWIEEAAVNYMTPWTTPLYGYCHYGQDLGLVIYQDNGTVYYHKSR